MHIPVPENELRLFARRPRLTLSTISPPSLVVNSSLATRREWSQAKGGQAAALLAKVASQPTSPRTLTRAATHVQSARSLDYFNCKATRSQGHTRAGKEEAQQRSRIDCENNSKQPLFTPDIRLPADQSRRIFQFSRLRKLRQARNPP